MSLPTNCILSLLLAKLCTMATVPHAFEIVCLTKNISGEGFTSPRGLAVAYKRTIKEEKIII
jgi:hypothetical protein